MKKIIITRRLLKESEEKASKIFDVKFNINDELYSQSKLIESSEGYDAILTSLTDKMDEETINKLPNSINRFNLIIGNLISRCLVFTGIVSTSIVFDSA